MEPNKNLPLISQVGVTIICTVILILVQVVTSSVSSPLNSGVAGSVVKALNEQEYKRMGGKENYDIISELQLEQIKGIVEQRKQEKGQGGDASSASSAETGEKGTISTEQLAAIKEGAYLKGTSGGKILWVEYSDLQCPFCARLHESGVIEEVMKNYGADVEFTFKHYPLPFHQNAKKAAMAAECVAEQNGAEGYFAFINDVFKQGDPTDAVLEKAAGNVKADYKKVTECISSDKYASKVDTQMNEGSSLFQVNGTPGNVLINTETGDYRVLSGAYPYPDFEAAIKALLGTAQ